TRLVSDWSSDVCSSDLIAHYLLLAVIHRICQPGPKTEVADWYRSTILQPLWSFSPERFRSQDFWDAFDQIQVEGDTRGGADELEIGRASCRERGQGRGG